MKPSKETLSALKKSYIAFSEERVLSCLKWIKKLNAELHSSLKETCIDDGSFWFYSEHLFDVRNQNNSFFSIQGIKGIVNRKMVEQPIILQNEVGYLGIISKNVDGVLYLLMQAKIEPGNINKVQISPTIQATKSNFTQMHGGKVPMFLDFFKDVDNYEVIYDGEQSEQCSRFLRKYNRNVFIKIDEPIPDHRRFMWLTIGDLKHFMNRYDNLVNMDTRTVLSCLPTINPNHSTDHSIALYKAWLSYTKDFIQPLLLPLFELKKWDINQYGVFCKHDYPFSIKFFDISIEDREVAHWFQPLAVANGKAIFATFIREFNGKKQMLIRIKEEIGCEYGSLYGPYIQKECNDTYDANDSIEVLFYNYLNVKKNVVTDIMLSEEGGRFYNEENRNVIIKLDEKDNDIKLPKNSYWANYRSLSRLIRQFRCANIQLRNLFSLIKEY